MQVKVQQLADDVQYQVVARGEAAHPSEDAAVLRDYFNLQACTLEERCREWSSRDERFRKIHTYFPGRQDVATYHQKQLQGGAGEGVGSSPAVGLRLCQLKQKHRPLSCIH